MRVNSLCIYLLLLLGITSCIEPFQPEIHEKQEVMVINGFVSDREGPLQVRISKSTPFNEPEYVPVTGCVVTVEDEKGRIFPYMESAPGLYETTVDAEFIGVGKCYALYVSTPDGREYRSDYDTLLACPPIDSLYFELQQRGTANPDIKLFGIQFFADIEGGAEYSENYRWIMEETWEYTAPHIPVYIWEGGPVDLYTSDSTYVCYMTTPVNELFSASTRLLSGNSLQRVSLHYVSNETPRLRLQYSVLVQQHALTRVSHDYWAQMATQVSSGGGLYETQPATVTGNIFRVDDPAEKVLGCFYAGQTREKRLTFKNDLNFEVSGFPCSLDTIQGVSELGSDFPYYLFSISETGIGPPYLTGPKQCFECERFGGTSEMPEYW